MNPTYWPSKANTFTQFYDSQYPAATTCGELSAQMDGIRKDIVNARLERSKIRNPSAEEMNALKVMGQSIDYLNRLLAQKIMNFSAAQCSVGEPAKALGIETIVLGQDVPAQGDAGRDDIKKKLLVVAFFAILIGAAVTLIPKNKKHGTTS